MPPRHIALAILVVAIYGTAFVAIQYAINEIPPLMATGYRYVLTALPLIFFIKKPNVSWAFLAAYGVMQGFVMFGLIFSAIKLGMPAGLASLVVQCQVFFTILFAFLVFNERPSTKQIIGASIAVAGIVVIGAGLAENFGTAAPIIPFLMTIASAAAWGAANIISKKAKPNAMLGFIVWSAAFAPVPLFLASMAFEGTQFGMPPVWPSAHAIWSILYLAYPTTILAFTAWVFLLREYSAAAVTPFALLIPIFGMGSVALVFGEAISGTTIAGSVLVLAGLAFAVLKFNQAKARAVDI